MAEKKSGRSAGPWALFLKLGGKLVSILIKLAKGLKFGKFAMAAGTFGAYSLMFSWKFVVVLMGSIFLHECGHIWAMRRCGMNVKGVYFLPFLGAAAVADGEFPSRKDESFIALMGPLWGLGLAAATFAVYEWTRLPLVAALAGWMAMVNLFNLLPINPLDGGRVMKSVAYSVSSWAGTAFLGLGLLACIVLAVWAKLTLMWLLLIVGAIDLLAESGKIRRAVRQNADPVRQAIIAATAAQLGVEPRAEKIIAELKRRKAKEGTQRLTLRFQMSNDGQAAEDKTWSVDGFCLMLGDAKEAMTGRHAVLAFAAYAGLAGLLAALMFATAHVPTAQAALGVFMD